MGAMRAEAGSGFGKHRHMMDARKLLINLLYLATAQSSEMSGWSHREKKPRRKPGFQLPRQAATVLATSWYSSIWSKFM